MKDFKCQNCGASLTLYLDHGRATCDYCGANYMLNRLDINKKNTTLNNNRDCPINTKIVLMDENPKDIEIFLTSPEWEAQKPERVLYTILQRMCSAAFVSYVLKKNYAIKKMVITRRYSWKTPYSMGDMSCLPKELQNMMREMETQNSQIESDVPPICAPRMTDDDLILGEWADKIDIKSDFTKKLEERGIIVSEVIEEKYLERSDWFGYESYRGTTYKEHRLEIEFPLITPQVFKQHFSDIFGRYEKIREVDIIHTITKEINEWFKIIRINVASVPANETLFYEYRFGKYGVSWDAELSINRHSLWHSMGFSPPPRIMWRFHDFGMSEVTDFTTMQAIKIAIIEKLLMNSTEDGRNTIDLYYDMRESVGLKTRSEYDLDDGIRLIDLVKTVEEKEYKTW